ncbi:flagellar hook assembly protein FlgD [Aestuariivirga sp.]|uniref:flagellar hook assembly protein FlgD n=1 Tax=Aestuariivirga sp. TaxID=2650926 RepID=UPI0039E2FF9A
MQITSATSSTATQAASSDTGDATLNYNAFLRLLVAEMKNQDPTQPNDPTEQLSQLASFSNVEQGIKMNAKLDSLLSMSSIGQSANLIGRTVSTSDGTMSGTVKSIEINSASSSAILEDGRSIDLASGITVS